MPTLKSATVRGSTTSPLGYCFENVSNGAWQRENFGDKAVKAKTYPYDPPFQILHQKRHHVFWRQIVQRFVILQDVVHQHWSDDLRTRHQDIVIVLLTAIIASFTRRSKDVIDTGHRWLNDILIRIVGVEVPEEPVYGERAIQGEPTLSVRSRFLRYGH